MKALPGFIFGVLGKRIHGNQLIGWRDLGFLQPLAVFMAVMVPNIFVSHSQLLMKRLQMHLLEFLQQSRDKK
jgi:hypothetical protein